jgi:hypothetical protein
MATVAQPKQSIREYRTERFEEMGFTSKEAERLADMTDSKGIPVDWHGVKKALDAGCGHVKALWIFSKEED